MDNGLPRACGPRNDSVAGELPCNDSLTAEHFVSDEEFRKWFNSRVVFSFEKQAGEVEPKRYFDTNCPEAALEGVGAIVIEIAKLTGMQVFEVLSRLTVHLMKGR